MPKEKYGESNPEFYAFSRGQPCFTHAGIVRIIADKCRERLNARPDGIETFSLCASDNAGVCLCDRCLAAGNSGARNLYLVNAVASDLARTHPDRFLLTFYAYWATREACAKLYGAAADPMYEFYRTFEEAASRSTARGVNWNLPSPHELYTPEVEAEATRYLEAAAAAATSDLSRARVAEEQRMWGRARSVLVRLRAGNVEDTFPVLLDGRPRNYSRPKIAISTLRWLHGLLRDTPVFVIDPDGQKHPPQDNEVFVLATGVQFATK